MVLSSIEGNKAFSSHFSSNAISSIQNQPRFQSSQFIQCFLLCNQFATQRKYQQQLFENATKNCVTRWNHFQRHNVLYCDFYICAYSTISSDFKPFYKWTDFKHLSLRIQQPVALKHANFALFCKCYHLVLKKSDFVIWLELIFSFLDSWIWYTQVMIHKKRNIAFKMMKQQLIQCVIWILDMLQFDTLSEQI